MFAFVKPDCDVMVMDMARGGFRMASYTQDILSPIMKSHHEPADCRVFTVTQLRDDMRVRVEGSGEHARVVPR
jgi:hypothetical protein